MMMGFGLIGIILVIALVVLAVGWRPRGGQIIREQNQLRDPQEVLKERYARGELNKEEFLMMKRDLA